MSCMCVCVCSMLFVCLFVFCLIVCFNFHFIVVERENMMLGGEGNGEELGRVGGGERIRSKYTVCRMLLN